MLKCIVIGIFTVNFALLVLGNPIEAGISSEYSNSGFSDFLLQPECKDKDAVLCTEVEEYPSDGLIPNLIGHTDVEVSNNYGEKDYGDNICQTVIKDTMPQAGSNDKDVLMYIVNVEGVYTQVVREEMCLGVNSTCNNVVDVLGYKSYCQQTYTYQSLLAFDGFFQVSTQFFKIPSGCCCTTKELQRI